MIRRREGKLSNCIDGFENNDIMTMHISNGMRLKKLRYNVESQEMRDERR